MAVPIVCSPMGAGVDMSVRPKKKKKKKKKKKTMVRHPRGEVAPIVLPPMDPDPVFVVRPTRRSGWSSKA